MSHSWVGAPAVFNGTNLETGGDSSKSCLYPESPFPAYFWVVLVH